MARYDFRLFSPGGATLGSIRHITSADIAYSQGKIGAVTLLLDGEYKAVTDWTQYSTLEIWREIDGRTYLEGERLWYLMDVGDARNAEGRHLTELLFVGSNYHIEQREVMYNADNAYSKKTDYADDMLKELVRENCGSSATDTARDATAWLTVAADLGAAPSIEKAFSRRPLLDVFKEICAQSRDAGTYLTWDTVRTGVGVSEFRTYTGQRGTNRGTGSSNPLELSWEAGTLLEPRIQWVRAGRPTYVEAAGQGEGAARVTKTAYLANLTALTRYERCIDARNVTTDNDLQAEANAELETNKPILKFSAKIGENRFFRYGYDISYGDKLRASYGGYVFDVHLTAVNIQLDETGLETLDLRLNNYDDRI